jgi:hypothetical protein
MDVTHQFLFELMDVFKFCPIVFEKVPNLAIRPIYVMVALVLAHLKGL